MPQDQSFGFPLLWYYQQKQSEWTAIWRSIILGIAFRDFHIVNRLIPCTHREADEDRRRRREAYMHREAHHTTGPQAKMIRRKPPRHSPQPTDAPQARYRRSNSPPPTTPVPSQPFASGHTVNHAKPPLKNYFPKTIPSTDLFGPYPRLFSFWRDPLPPCFKLTPSQIFFPDMFTA